MTESYELFKNIGMIVFVLFLIYFIFLTIEKMKNVQEGLKNNNNKNNISNKRNQNNKNNNNTNTNANTNANANNNSTTSTTSTTSTNQNINMNVVNGIAGNAAGYAASIKTQVIKLQDVLLISKYKSDYENVIINMHDLVNNLMLQTVLSIDHNNPTNGLDVLISLNDANNALNNVMSYLDTQ
jgi:hypothetical protein